MNDPALEEIRKKIIEYFNGQLQYGCCVLPHEDRETLKTYAAVYQALFTSQTIIVRPDDNNFNIEGKL